MGFHHIFFSWYLKNLIHATLVILNIFQRIIGEKTHWKTPFLWTFHEWNKLDSDIGQSTHRVFKQHLLEDIWPQPATFNFLNFPGLHLLTRLQLALRHLNGHRFNYNFQNCNKPLRICSLEVESTSHFFQLCLHYNDIQATLLNQLKSIDENVLKLSDNKLINLLLYGYPQFDSNKNIRSYIPAC